MCGAALPKSDYYAGRRRVYCSNRCKQKAKRQRRRAFRVVFRNELKGNLL